ncbi:MAG TPA: DUF2141 domain-containing protein [Bacteroidales bacterium]
MKKMKIKKLPLFIGMSLFLTAFIIKGQTQQATYSLTIEVNELRNNEGVVVFALYNSEDALPDEHYEKYFKIATGKIENGSSSVIFENLPAGKYAINILHDENEDGEIKKGFILPKEGIGFSNYQSIGLSNRPKFSNASFDLKENKTISVKIIYM